jgi:hypothetical protein
MNFTAVAKGLTHLEASQENRIDGLIEILAGWQGIFANVFLVHAAN